MNFNSGYGSPVIMPPDGSSPFKPRNPSLAKGGVLPYQPAAPSSGLEEEKKGGDLKVPEKE